MRVLSASIGLFGAGQVIAESPIPTSAAARPKGTVLSPFAILHIPHSATAIPAELRSNLRISDETLERELLLLTDWYADDIYALPAWSRSHGSGCDPKVPEKHVGRRTVHSILVELNRALYMNEISGAKLPGFPNVAATVQEILRTLIRGCRAWASPRV